MSELRIVRLVVTLGFLFMVSVAAVKFAGPWGYVVGALLFGTFAAFLWREQLAADANAQVIETNARVQAQRESARRAGTEGRSAQDASAGDSFDPTKSW